MTGAASDAGIDVMREVAIVRAAHLNSYLEVLRDIGAPVSRALASARLPTAIEEMPDAYVTVDRAMDCVRLASRDMPLLELAFLATRRPTMEAVTPAFRAALLLEMTGRARIDAFMRLARSEDSAIATWTSLEGDTVRWVCDLPAFRGHPMLCCAEWLNLNVMVSVLRSIAGADARLLEMGFVSGGPAPMAMREAFSQTRLRFGEPHTYVRFPASLMARACAERLGAGEPSAMALPGAAPWSLAAMMRELIRPYLDDGYPDIALAAGLVGMSPRTLQRRLKACGRTYSDVVQEARFDLARELLTRSDTRIIDVAFMAGYQNPQHFSRAFRKLAGVSPRTFRRGALPES